MKKVSIFMAIAAAASLASCTAQSPKANLSTELDSLSYSIGMAQTQGLKGYLVGRMDVDTAYLAEFIKGVNEGAKKSGKKETAYMAGLQIGQQISNQMMKGINQELFGTDSTKTISKENFMAGFIAGTLEKGGVMTMEAAQEYTRTAMETIKAKALEEKYADYAFICGIDEAGRGPLAGPVVVASVIMPENSMIEGVNDSKKVSEKKREKLYDLILSEAISYGVGIIGQDEIDEINILNATKKGLTISLQELTQKPDLIIVDALNNIDTLGTKYESIIKGDAKCYSIAAASIIAKVTRDRIMREWDKVYPQYGFVAHKGYGTVAHIKALKEYGACPLHRKTFIKHFI